MGKRRNGEGTWGKKVIHGDTYFFFRDSNGNYTYGKSEKIVNQKLENKKKQTHTVLGNSKPQYQFAEEAKETDKNSEGIVK